MTLFLSFRTADIGGDVAGEPYLFEGNGLVDRIGVRALDSKILQDRVAGKEVLFATHGFNVSYANGVRALAALEAALNLTPRFLFVGVLWPGDYWIPVVNYPAEAADAVRCGRLLAKFANTRLRLAGALSFVSHSLGGRLVLEAVKHLDRPAREVCLLAAAVDDDCLGRQYAEARTNAQRISILASTRDLVLRLAYRAGDLASDLGFDDDSPWRPALGYHGPRPAALERVAHAQIPVGDDYGHLDYFPPRPRAARVARYVAESLLGLPHAWP